MQSPNSIQLSAKQGLTLVFAVLAVQNFLTFLFHYTGEVTFTKDFTVSYYPMTAYWIDLFRHGIQVEWVPTQTMGMPMVLTMQSGLFYPFYWVFVLLDFLPFTLHAATVFQCLHVLAGAIGVYLLARIYGMSLGAALFCAVSFQFFGGTYVISSSPDILRAYAWLPWLLWATYIAPDQQGMARRNLCLPAIMLFLITGAYPGATTAQVLMAALLCLFTWSQYLRQSTQSWKVISLNYLNLFFLAMLGLALASVYLVPVTELKEFLMRGKSWGGNVMNWRFSYWNTLFSASYAEGIYKDPATKSAYVGLPVFCLLFLLTWKDIKTRWPLFLTACLAVLMAKAHQFFLFTPLINLFEFIGYSRFIASDYRGVFSLLFILMAAFLLEKNSSYPRAFIIKRAALCLFPILSCYGFFTFEQYISSLPQNSLQEFVSRYPSLSKLLYVTVSWSRQLYEQVDAWQWLRAIIFLPFIFSGLFVLQDRKAYLQIIFIIFTTISASLYLTDMKMYWHSEARVDTYYDGLALDQPLPATLKAQTDLLDRPACQDMGVWENTWRGFLLGDSLCNAHVAVTNPRQVVRENPSLEKFMLLPGRLVDLKDSVCRPERLTQAAPSRQVHIFSYGLQEIRYQVQAEQDFCFVENELFFRGWRGKIDGIPDQDYRPVAHCEVLRSWCLPAGHYTFSTHYRTPGLRTGWYMSLLALAVYLLIIGWRGLREKSSRQNRLSRA
jgi:hypothetical protein